jgi:uncharacterized membrane protein YhaH (DUF805 family)
MPVWRLLFGFQGRIRRVQWWYGHAAAFLGLALMVMAFAVAAANMSPSANNDGAARTTQGGLRFALYALYTALLWVSVALGVKRYHDLDRSGWWILLGFIPVANIWMLLELGFVAGVDGRNRFGSSPKEMNIEELRNTFS